MWGANAQHIVGLLQVQRMYIQYFSHSNNIQQTVQVGARLANGTHHTGYTIVTRGIQDSIIRVQRR